MLASICRAVAKHQQRRPPLLWRSQELNSLGESFSLEDQIRQIETDIQIGAEDVEIEDIQEKNSNRKFIEKNSKVSSIFRAKADAWRARCDFTKGSPKLMEPVKRAEAPAPPKLNETL